MRTLLLSVFFVFLAASSSAQDKCVTQILLQQKLDANPEYVRIRQHQREYARLGAETFSRKPQFKTTAVAKIPVVFHVVLTESKINQLGGNSGVLQRAIDQIAVLNEDFNRTNADNSKVPAPFASLSADLDIEFGLAHRKPDGSSTNGVEIQPTTVTSFSALSNGGSDPKSTSTGGLDPWDPNRYLNIWIVDITENGVLGYTVPPSYMNLGYTLQELGLVLDYGCFGRRGGSINFFNPSTNDRGRTGTHEVAHFFELEHIFGLGSGCPSSGDSDDGIADTPPQNAPTYNASFAGGVIPFPLTDVCSPNSPGIMWMNFMDYTDDASMYMFTQGQAVFVYNQLTAGVLKSLTEHPELLDWPTGTADIDKEVRVEVFPNPSEGKIFVNFTDTDRPQTLHVVNAVGSVVKIIDVTDNSVTNYQLDLTPLSKGVYMIRCIFADGIITRKIVLQ